MVKYYQVEERDSIWVFLSVAEADLTFALKAVWVTIGNLKSRTSIWLLGWASGVRAILQVKAKTVRGKVTWFH